MLLTPMQEPSQEIIIATTSINYLSASNMLESIEIKMVSAYYQSKGWSALDGDNYIMSYHWD